MLGGIVRGEHATLRVPLEEDLPAVGAWMADLRVRRGGQLWDQPAALATWKERLTEAAKDEDTVLWTIEAGGRPVGTARVGLSREVPSAHVRHFVIDPAAWGRGLGADAALALHRYLFDSLDLRDSSVALPADNAAGLRIAERLGFREFGRGHDVYFRDGAYADQVHLRLERATWEERWGSVREYAPLPPEAGR